MTNNDTSTLTGSLQQLGETMADNLVTMGVTDADPSDGLTTLAGKILNVPGGGSLDLDTSITLTSDETVIDQGDSVTLTSVLSASYDDETSSNVDLSGILIGATILFKEGSTTIGTATTNSNGIATATISNLTGGSHTIKAVFEGTSAFDGCESSTITITVIGDEYMEIIFNGTKLTQPGYTPTNPLIGENVVIDYGDGTIVNDNNYGHTYATSGDHTIKVYGVTGLGPACFSDVDGLKSVIMPPSVTSLGTNCFTNVGTVTSIYVPSSVTSIGNYCFASCESLSHVYLNWDSANDILPFSMYWINNSVPPLKFYIPHGTTSLYVAKNYPELILVEVIEPASISLTADKSILSYADSQSATLSATVLDADSQPIEGETVEFFNGSTSMGTSTTNSSGVATKSYSSTGAGDISFTAEVRSLVSETFAIEDCYYFDPQTENKNRYTVASGSASISYGSNGCTITGSTASTTFVKNTALTLPSEYTATFEITACNGDSVSGGYAYGGVVFDDWFTDWYSTDVSDTYKLSTTTMLTSNYSKIQANDVIKIVRENGTMKQYINNVLVSTDNNINHTGYFQHRTYKQNNQNGRSLTVKNLKIKPL